MANARQHVEAVDELLSGLVARLQSDAQAARDVAVEDAEATVGIASRWSCWRACSASC